MSQPQEQGASAGAYAFLGLLTLLNVMNFVDRQLLASFSNFIIPDLNLTDGQFGLLTGLVFIIFYATVGLFAGALADRVHRPRLVAAGLMMWSALTAVSGAARGFVSLAIPRMFIGVGESVLTPASMSMLADRFPARSLGLAAGIYYMGVPIGVGVSLIIAGTLGPAIGWRNCFYLLGALGMVMAVFMFFLPETQRRGALAAAEAGAPREKILPLLLGALRRSPSLGLTIAGGITMHFILGAAVFDQRWFALERGFDPAWIANVTGWMFVVFGVLGNLFGGWASDVFQRVTGQGRPMFLFWVMLILLPINAAYRLVPPDSIWFWIGIAAAGFQVGTFYGPTFSTVQELAPAQARATIVAFYILCLNLIGLGIGVTAAGFTIDWMRAAGWAEPYTWTLMAFTLISALSIPLFLMAGLRFRKDREALLASA